MPALIDIKMPPGDEETGKNILANWLFKVGESVVENEPLIEISTDKVNMEIAAPTSGVLQEILIQEGQELKANDILGRIDQSSQKKRQDLKQNNSEKTVHIADKVTIDSKFRLSPVVKRLIKEHHINVNDLIGTAASGRISKKDVLSYLNRDQTNNASLPDLENKFIPHNPMRKSIAEHMVNSLLKTAPHVTSVFEMDLTAIIANRNRLKDQFNQKGVKLTFTSYFIFAAVEAIKKVPEINSRFHSDGLELFSDINIGIGTALEDKGLIVPVIEKAQNLNLFEIASKLQELTDKARTDKLSPADVKNGTFTISNHGVSGSLIATPIIINQPQSAILGIGKMEKRIKVVEMDGIDQLLIKQMAYVTLSIDHRVLDAFHTNAFLSHFVDIIDNWSG